MEIDGGTKDGFEEVLSILGFNPLYKLEWWNKIYVVDANIVGTKLW